MITRTEQAKISRIQNRILLYKGLPDELPDTALFPQNGQRVLNALSNGEPQCGHRKLFESIKGSCFAAPYFPMCFVSLTCFDRLKVSEPAAHGDLPGFISDRIFIDDQGAAE